MEPRYSISNITVKRYCGENTSGGVLWENSAMPKFFSQKKNDNGSEMHAQGSRNRFATRSLFPPAFETYFNTRIQVDYLYYESCT